LPQALAYEPAATRRRALLARWSFTTLALCLAAAALLHWGPESLRRVEMFWLQRQCAAFCLDSATPALRQVPECWTRFYAKLSPPGGNPDGMIFLHERHSPAGNRRLVAIELHAGSDHDSAQLLTSRLITPGNPTRLPREVLAAGGSLRFRPELSIGTARPDDSDPSHFVFEADNPAGGQTFDGWLTDDDRLIIEPRRD